MTRTLCSLLVATSSFGGVALADAPKSKNAKVTLLYQHENAHGSRPLARTAIKENVR